MSDHERGIYRKFRVERLNDPAGKHRDCRYYVLDLEHDAFAGPALRAYADACAAEFPALAADLRATFPPSAPPPADPLDAALEGRPRLRELREKWRRRLAGGSLGVEARMIQAECIREAETVWRANLVDAMAEEFEERAPPATTWAISTDEESFFGHFESKEEAIAAAPGETGLGAGARFWVGRAVPYVPQPFDADRLLEQLGQDAADEVGEIAEDWPYLSRPQTDALEEEVHQVVMRHLAEADALPKFFTCEEVTEHQIPDEEPEPAPAEGGPTPPVIRDLTRRNPGAAT